ncbi:MAG: molybdopterin-synthase adenylyltransferase MoeB [Pseudomonadota bacterium]|jgi:adenylyltransferase/sulfurtransferase|uniref:Molybdopterin-synthase adenylyltransferase n=1 Tax=Thiothrix fructosivorans TaxID=111770 RepID=A0A8B0SR06_9GAMM|nr:molybdopterin-synthase adenylyltransferase MoeB [Thiothrix fructosivorans]MBO0612390.1 molybdopterin-synthase adenylyltransferase MoeB [Thiothrix fructosivorans]QTX12127.1 molybdopterin-synthase adenylyltransferase MoeB [Thiothrix fructosivorans]
MDDEQLLRYSRQIMLPQIDIAGQEKLSAARVLIMGVGGLGSPVAMYLATSGVGTLVLCDPDVVDLTNLQRQIIHDTPKVGQLKVASAAETLRRLNPDITVETLPRKLDETALLSQMQRADVVVDCTDNLESRLLINRVAVAARKPLVSAAAIRWEGQISVFQPYLGENPCYHCFYGKVGGIAQTCSENGVVGPLLGILGSMQALEVVKLLVGVGTTLTGRVLLFDGQAMEWMGFALPRDPACPVCGGINRHLYPA